MLNIVLAQILGTHYLIKRYKILQKTLMIHKVKY